MGIFLAAAVIFALAFLGMALGLPRKKDCSGCSCKDARRILGDAQHADCDSRRQRAARTP